MSLRARKKKEKTRRIENAGRELFASQGFEPTTTRDLAKHAGIGAGTLFVYFPRKLDLLVHLFVHDIGEVLETAFTALDPELELIDSVMHVFVALFDYYERDKRLARVFLKELMFIEPGARRELDALTLDFIQRLAPLVTRAKERGDLPAHVAELEAAYHFFSAYTFALVSWLSSVVPKAEQRRMLERSLALLVGGLRTTPSP